MSVKLSMTKQNKIKADTKERNPEEPLLFPSNVRKTLRTTLRNKRKLESDTDINILKQKFKKEILIFTSPQIPKTYPFNHRMQRRDQTHVFETWTATRIV